MKAIYKYFIGILIFATGLILSIFLYESSVYEKIVLSIPVTFILGICIIVGIVGRKTNES